MQAYTHALWMFALSGVYAITREMYFTPIFFSIAPGCGFACGAVLVPRGRLPWVSLRWRLSNAFVDYSTSGLENPLSHLLLVLFVLVYFNGEPSQRKLFWLSLIASLAAVNRLDMFVVYLPALVFVWWQVRGWRSMM